MAARSKTTRPRKSKTQTALPPTPLENTAAAVPPPAVPKGKLGAVITLLRRPQGATIAELMAATGWQAHSVRGALSGALKKKLGLAIASDKTEAGRVYRIAPDAAA